MSIKVRTNRYRCGSSQNVKQEIFSKPLDSRRSRIWVSEMFIDKFTFTLDIEPARRSQVLRNIGFNAQEDVEAILNGRKPNVSSSHNLWFTDKRYLVTHRISVGLGREGNLVQDDPTNDLNLLIQFAPRYSDWNYARVSVNVNESDWPQVVEYLTSIIDERIESILERCRITLLETTFDIYGIEHKNLYVYGMRTGRAVSYFDGASNFYFGGDDSHRKYVHYDKKKHIQYKNSKRPSCGREVVPEQNISRVEIRHTRSSEGEEITFQNAFELFKYFTPISVFHVKDKAVGFTPEEILRLELAKHRSLVVVTRNMKRGERKKFIEKLRVHKLAKFHALNFEEQLQRALSRLVINI